MTFRTVLTTAAGLLVGALSLSASAAPNLMTNGSFESPDVAASPATTYSMFSNLGGWTVLGDNVQLVDAGFLSPGYSLTASHGSQWVDLTGSNEGLGKGLTQSFNGSLGQQYKLSFDIGKLFERGDAYVTVYVNGAASTFANTEAAGASTSMGWQSVSLVFNGQASNSITFLGAGAGAPGSSTTVIGLDNVSVTAVPEPESYAMMLAGLGALGFMARRRRQ